MSDGLLTIGEVARATGLKVSGVRYYGDIGLVDVAARVGRARMFRGDAIDRIRFMQRCQQAGFSLDEIREILDDSAGGWHQLVDSKIAQLTEQRDHLDSVIALLGEARTCGCQAAARCSFVAAP